MKLFFIPDIINIQTLSEEESHHCSKVLRLKNNDIIYITDGSGNLYKSKIVAIHPKKTEIEILEVQQEYGKRPYYIHIAIAPTKNIDRFEWFIEKSTEIGIDEITPLLCKNSERKIIKTERLNKIAESAMKQSYKAYHPKINDLTTLNHFIKNNPSLNSQKFIAHCEDEEKIFLGKQIEKKSEYLILIGPEGDFTLDEIHLAKQEHFSPTSLGKNRLRTETAGIVACNIASIINQL
ncbi:MAG: 16S rRNA (uracil(1498)-N(3))-methyltransferase [Bacteroidales bacterium]|jgi:16S rRNA (uracil1498-N3)-methyltransferase|nr:16S rRNA (uracil(1498)-N(3))-methyltransferase [Bacteroidales bacterium]